MPRFLMASVVAVLAYPVMVAAQQPPADVNASRFPYPASAPVVVCLNGYEKTRTRLNKLLTTALPQEAEKLTKLLDEQLEKLMEGRKLDGIRKDGRIYLVVNNIESILEDTPAVSILIPVTSQKEFVDSFLTREEFKSLANERDGPSAFKTILPGEETTVFLVDLKDYVALSLDKPTADSYVAKYAVGTTQVMGSELAETFLKSDLALLVNVEQINDQYGEQIRGIRGLIDFGLQQAMQGGMLPGFGMKQVDAMKELLKGAFQAVEDCQAVVIGGEFRSDGLALRMQVRFSENSPSAKFVQAEASPPVVEISKLPSGLAVYNQMQLGKTFTELLREMSQEFVTTDEDQRGAMLIEQHTRDRVAAGHRGDWSASTSTHTAIAISNYKEAEKAARAITKCYKAVAAGGRINSIVLKNPPRVQDEAETYRTFVFTRILLVFDFDATVANLPEQVQEATLQNLKRTAQETTSLWIGTDGKLVITLTAKDWETARGLLDQYLDGKQMIGTEKAYKATRARLPEDATFVMIGETGGLITALVDAARPATVAIPGFPQLGKMPEPKGERTFVGFAITLKGDIVHVNAFVPTDAIGVGYKLIDNLLKIKD